MQPPIPITTPGSAGSSPVAEPRTHILSLDRDELRAWLKAQEIESYRADQMLEWIYRRGARTFTEMTNLSQRLRADLQEKAVILSGAVTRDIRATDGTRKLLLTFPDGGAVETVWIPAADRNTACISSQVGCPVGCRFCASGIAGVERSLTAGEIVEQALRISRLIVGESDESNVAAGVPPAEDGGRGEGSRSREQGTGNREPEFSDEGEERTGRSFADRTSIKNQKSKIQNRASQPRPATAGLIPQSAISNPPSAAAPRLSNIVLMGMGEPLANYHAVVHAIRTLNAAWGLGVGARKITLSTVGLPKQIRQLAHEELQLNLAFSLHAPNDELRREIIPWAEKIPLDEILSACRYYFDQTGREVTLEYVLLDQVNDRPKHADQLARLARRVRGNVNLLLYNPVEGLPFERPDAETARTFLQRLHTLGVNAHIRTSRGLDVDAACGQLRRSAANPRS